MHSFKKMLQSLYFHNYPFHGEMSNTITAGTSDHLLIFSLVYVDINWQILEITGLRGPWRGVGGGGYKGKRVVVIRRQREGA